MKKLSLKIAFAFTLAVLATGMVFPVGLKAAQPTKEEQKTIKEARERIEAESEEDDPNWGNEIIVGWQFTPDKALMKKLKNVEEHTNDKDFSFYYDKTKYKGMTEEQFYASLYNIAAHSYDGKERFELYGVHDSSKMYVKTTDDQYVEILVSPVSLHEELPDTYMADYDGDDEYELAILPHILHGTGYYEDTCIIVDKSENGTWFAYHLPMDVYRNYFDEHMEVSCKDKKLSMKLDGEEVGKPIKVDSNDYNYYFASLINIAVAGDSILVNTVPAAYSEKRGWGMSDLSDYKIWLPITYKGMGQFSVNEAMYQLSATNLYADETAKVSDDKFYGFVEGPCVEIPLMLVSDSVIEQVTAYDEDSIYGGHAPCFCEVYLKKNKNSKMTKIGDIEGSTNVYAIGYNENNIVVREHHNVTTYTVENDKLVMDVGIQDDMVCAYGEKYKGYGTFDGKKFKKISKSMYEEYRKEYTKVYEPHFQRGF